MEMEFPHERMTASCSQASKSHPQKTMIGLFQRRTTQTCCTVVARKELKDPEVRHAQIMYSLLMSVHGRFVGWCKFFLEQKWIVVTGEM